jgi:hypothetical protein
MYNVTIFFISLLCTSLTHAQQSVNSSGNMILENEGSVSYSVGQIVYMTLKNDAGCILQGVQQPYEIITNETIEIDSNFSIQLFPNPTADRLIIDIEEFNNEKIYCLLNDFSGKILFKKLVFENQTQVEMGQLPTGIYFLNIMNDKNKIIQSFKIIKN